MTTLNTEQVQFLSEYAIMQIDIEVENKLKALRKTDEWKEAIEKGKKDKDVLKRVEDYKKRLEDTNKLFKIENDLKTLNSDLHITQLNDYNKSFDKVHFSEQTDIEKTINEYLEEKATYYAKELTGYYTSWHSLPYRKVREEIKGRLSVTNVGNFDEIVDSMIERFDIDSLVKEYVEYSKTEDGENAIYDPS